MVKGQVLGIASILIALTSVILVPKPQITHKNDVLPKAKTSTPVPSETPTVVATSLSSFLVKSVSENELVIDQATLERPGFIVCIMADNKGIVGESKILVGNVGINTIQLTKVEAGDKLEVLIYLDDGDKTLNIKKDTPALDSKGNIIQSKVEVRSKTINGFINPYGV